MRLTNTLQNYRRDWLGADLTAGLIVAILITPQAIAYAMLAGMPPQAGLYAALLPVIVYALLGTSPVLAVGPVAIISLMTFEALQPLASPGSSEYMALAAGLALLTGLWLLLFFLIDLGRWTNFISHSVISAFTSAAAILIVLSQIRHVTGLPIPSDGPLWQPIQTLLSASDQLRPDVLLLSALALLLLLSWQKSMPHLTRRLPQWLASLLNKAAPLVLVIAGIAAVSGLALPVKVVGELPAGLPALQLPWLTWPQWQSLLPSAAVIALIGYLESLAVAQSLADRRGPKLHSNQELLALGGANLVAAFSQAFPVAGGFGRSVVNHAAGAKTQLASIITALLVAIICLFAARLFMNLPNAVLAVIIVVAVWPLIRFAEGWQAWRYQKSDGLVWLMTFAGVLLGGAESGILLGMLLSLVLFLKRTSEPHIAEIGRVGNSDHFRNIRRHQVGTSPTVLMIRIDENLYFANSHFLQETIANSLQQRPAVQHVVLVGSAINHIDYIGLETLQHLLQDLRERGVQLHLAEFKGPVMDRLNRGELLQQLAPGRIFFTASEALRELGHC